MDLPSGSWGVPLKMMRYVVRKRAPSAGRMCGPPRRPPVASSLPSGSKSTRNPSDTNSSPGSSAGRRIFGWWGRKKKNEMTHHTQEQKKPTQTVCVCEPASSLRQGATQNMGEHLCHWIRFFKEPGNWSIITMSNHRTTWPQWETFWLHVHISMSSKAHHLQSHKAFDSIPLHSHCKEHTCQRKQTHTFSRVQAKLKWICFSCKNYFAFLIYWT